MSPTHPQRGTLTGKTVMLCKCHLYLQKKVTKLTRLYSVAARRYKSIVYNGRDRRPLAILSDFPSKCLKKKYNINIGTYFSLATNIQ